jgi:hypothetical protein
MGAMRMQLSRIAKWQPKGVAPATHTAINTEWGRYSSNVLPRVQEDLDLDAETGNLKGELLGQHITKRISARVTQPEVCPKCVHADKLCL